MRILYWNVIEQHAGWGAEWFMNRALQALGHETHCIDYRQHRTSLVTQLHSAPPCDVFLLQRGDHVPTALVRAITVPRFFWATELVSRCDDQRALLRERDLFTHVFFRTPACIAAAVANGWVDAGDASILLSSFDPETCRPLALTRDIDVLFLGCLTPRRREWLDRLRQRGIAVHVAAAYGAAMNTWFNRARIVLNIHAGDFPDTETRVFEVLGSGAFLLTERLSEESPFTSEDLAEFAGFDELCERIRHYLAHEEERARLAQHGHQTAIRQHTYVQRAREMVANIGRYAEHKRR